VPNWLGTGATRGDPSPLGRTAIPTGTGTRTTKQDFRAAAGPPQPGSSAPADRFRLVLLHSPAEQRTGPASLFFVRRASRPPRLVGFRFSSPLGVTMREFAEGSSLPCRPRQHGQKCPGTAAVMSRRRDLCSAIRAEVCHDP